MSIRRFNIYEIIFIVFLLISVGFSAHFILIDRVGFWRLIYPLQAKIAILNIQCSNYSPVWMKQSLKIIIQKQKTLSNQLAYIDKNNQLHTCQSGWAKTSIFSKQVSVNTRFRYASLTKIITNDAVIDLINQKKINLNDRLINIFEELNNKKLKDNRIKNITVSDLLQQRSGFDRMRSEDIMFSTHKTPWCPNDLHQLLKVRLDFNPNTRYAYDNRNSCLLGAIIERVTGDNYREYINEKYGLASRNIKFLNGQYFSDEVYYDFRNNDFWMEEDDNSFYFKELSSSAGLSGSAKSLAEIIQPMLERQPLNILSIEQDNIGKCNLTDFKMCNGYAMWQYQKDSQSPKVYFRNGGLPAATSLAVISDQGEVLVWTSNGTSLYTKDYDENWLEKYFYQILSNSDKYR